MRYPSAESTGFFLLLSFLFVTPLIEVLMNILIVSLLIWWLSVRNIIDDLSTTPLYLKCFLLFSILPLMTLITSDITEAEDLIFDIKGAVKLGIVLLPVYSLAMLAQGREKSVTWSMLLLVGGGLAACIDGFALWEKGKDPSYPELRGIGHVNQSALYMCLVAISAFVLVFQKSRRLVLFGVFAIIVSFIFFFLSRSLNAYVVLTCVCAFVTGIMIIEKRYKGIVRMFVGLAVIFLGFMLILPDSNQSWDMLKTEISSRIHGHDPTSRRLHIFRTAIEIYDQHRWFGVGPDQFYKATSPERIKAELEAENRNYDQEKYKFWHTNHGHNVWVSVLVERGLTGIFLVALFFASSGFLICRLTAQVLSRSHRDHQLTQLVFLSGATWITLFAGGIANTTLHREHGLVGVVLLVWSITSLELRLASRQGSKDRSCIG